MKTSRAITSCLIWSCISGGTGRPARCSCDTSASTRALGTGLPLTIAMFWAEAGRVRPNVAAAIAAMRKCFMTEVPKGVTADVPKGSDDLDGQRVQAARGEFPERIIHKPVLRHFGQAGESRRRNPHPEMSAGTGAVGAGVARVLPAFVEHFERRGREDLLQALVQRLRRDAGAHGSTAGACSSTRAR